MTSRFLFSRKPTPELNVIGDSAYSALDPSYFHSKVMAFKNASRSLRKKTSIDVLLYSERPEYFCAHDLIDRKGGEIRSISLVSGEIELLSLQGRFDLALVCTAIGHEQKAEFIIRARKLAPLLLAWTWDNHHHLYENHCGISLADIVLPAHHYCKSLLKTPHAVLGKTFPLCCSQWSRKMGTALLDESLRSRSDALYGGYVSWAIGDRGEFLSTLKDQLPGNAITQMDIASRNRYFERSAEDKFRDWASFKVSLALPLLNDLSFRVFDALFCGQIPLVPTDCYDLNDVISPELQSTLPIIRFDEYSIDAVRTAWRQAVQQFDKLGSKGARKRHEFVCEHHHISVRLLQIVQYALALANSEPKLSLSIDDSGIGLLHV